MKKKYYNIDACRGCGNKIVNSDSLLLQVKKLCEEYLEIVSQEQEANVRPHKKYKISLSHCPNGCSRPQIAHLGITGACSPNITAEHCAECGACADACAEGAVMIAQNACPQIDFSKCMRCAQCVRVCPTGALEEGGKGFRLAVGGRLGRHPKLGVDLGMIFTEKEVVDIFMRILKEIKKNCNSATNFGDLTIKAVMDIMPEAFE